MKKSVYVIKYLDTYLSTGGVEARTTTLALAQRFTPTEAAMVRLNAFRRQNRGASRLDVVLV